MTTWRTHIHLFIANCCNVYNGEITGAEWWLVVEIHISILILTNKNLESTEKQFGPKMPNQEKKCHKSRKMCCSFYAKVEHKIFKNWVIHKFSFCFQRFGKYGKGLLDYNFHHKIWCNGFVSVTYYVNYLRVFLLHAVAVCSGPDNIQT